MYVCCLCPGAGCYRTYSGIDRLLPHQMANPTTYPSLVPLVAVVAVSPSATSSEVEAALASGVCISLGGE